MPERGTVTFVPSVHFSPRHRRRVRETIREHNPDIVAVELCERRFDYLDQDTRLAAARVTSKLVPGATQVYQIFRIVQKTSARLYGFDPGQTDMEAAIDTAGKLETDVALIDDPIDETMDSLAKSIGPDTPLKMLMRLPQIDLTDHSAAVERTIPPFTQIDSGEDVEPTIDYLRQLVPEVTEVLIDDRDQAMARRLHTLCQEGYDVVAIIGAGHHLGVQKALDELDTADDEPAESVPVRTPARHGTDIPIV